MRKEKRSVIFFYDLLENITLLSDEEAGRLIKAIFNYEMYEIETEIEEPRIERIYQKAVKTIDTGKQYFDDKYNGGIYD